MGAGVEQGEQSTEPEPSDAEIAALQDVEDGYTRDDIRAMGPVMFMALVPVGLLIFTFSAIFGDRFWVVAPAVFIAAIYGMPIYRAWRGRGDSEVPLVIPGHGRFTGRAKRRLATGGAVVLLTAIVAYPFMSLTFSAWLNQLRDWAWSWTIPWPW